MFFSHSWAFKYTTLFEQYGHQQKRPHRQMFSLSGAHSIPGNNLIFLETEKKMNDATTSSLALRLEMSVVWLCPKITQFTYQHLLNRYHVISNQTVKPTSCHFLG